MEMLKNFPSRDKSFWDLKSWMQCVFKTLIVDSEGTVVQLQVNCEAKIKLSYFLVFDFY